MKFVYDKQQDAYISGEWRIQGSGGFITHRHYWIRNDSLNIYFWQFKLKKAKEMIEKLVEDLSIYGSIDPMYKEALYT